MKKLILSKKERQIIEERRKFIKIKRNCEKLTEKRKYCSQSKGEKAISEFLNSEGVYHEREWYFKGLYNYAKSCLLYFDFYLPDYNLCIEFDGLQHYQKQKTEAAKMNDFLKNAYCKKNGINFLRIKYDQYEDIDRIILAKIDEIAPIAPKS